MSRLNRQEVSVAAFPPVVEPCSQCKELLEVIELWKQAFRKSASHFLSVQRELIKAEAAAHRLGEIVSDQYRVDGDWEAQQRHGSKRRKGRSECSYDEPLELQQMLFAALTAASGLCKRGAVNCFETRKQPSIRSKEASNSPKVTKRHSWNEDSTQKDNSCSSSDGMVSGAANGQKRDGTMDAATPTNAANSGDGHGNAISYDVPRPSSDVPRPSSGVSLPSSGVLRPSSEVESISSVQSSSCASDDSSQIDHSHLAQRLQQLEGEKNRLLDKLEKQALENRKVRQSLGETLNDLESHEIQLALAMQDLVVATSEIKKASTMREQLNQLEREKEQLLRKMEKVEDESSCVKASLVQLLQEKSASNRHLQTENMHLRGLLRRESSDTLIRLTSDSGAPDDSLVISAALQPSVPNGDTAPVLSSVDMTDLPVHKVGYLTKEGGRVKSWKKRLFVLNSIGLFYYKADDPAGCIRLCDISKVEQCKGKSSAHPHMIAIATAQRTYYAGASSQEEMQSWIGMLESLRQHYQQSSSAPQTPSSLTASLTTSKRTTAQSKSPRLGTVELDQSPSQKRALRKGSPMKRTSDIPLPSSPLVSENSPSVIRPFSVFTTNPTEPPSTREIPQNASEAPPSLTVVPPDTGDAPQSTSEVPQSTNKETPPNTDEVPPNPNTVPQTTSEVPLPGPGERQSAVSKESRSSAVFSTDDTTENSSTHSHSTPV